MTITKDEVKSTGRQITVTVTSDNKALQGKLNQMGNPYFITKNFQKQDTADYILTVMKQDVKSEIRNWKKQNKSLVQTEVEFNV